MEVNIWKSKREIKNGRIISSVEIELIREYERYGLYQVYRVKDGKRVPIYKETYTEAQLKEIRDNNFIIDDEEELDIWVTL